MIGDIRGAAPQDSRRLAPRPDEQEGRLLGRAHELTEEEQAVVFGPLQVVDREEQRAPLGQPAEQVARETGAKYGGVLYVDSLSEGDGPVPTYLDMLRVTAETIAKGLTE